MNRYTLVYDPQTSAISFAKKQIADAVNRLGGSIEEKWDDPFSHKPKAKQDGTIRIILTTKDSAWVKKLGTENPYVQPMLERADMHESQAYAVHMERDGDRSDWWIIGGDAVGAMYGGLDLADTLLAERHLRKFASGIRTPHIPYRGIKFNLSLDARTPSYSDNSDSAQKNLIHTWDMNFWREFLDEMARHRFNVLTLWNLHPFPSLVKVPEYPEIALDDVMQTKAPIYASTRGLRMSTPETRSQLVTIKKMTIDEKIAFWREVMQYAKDRGIEVYWFIWNIFTYGTEGNRYGIDDRQDNERTIDYFRASVRALFLTYPLLAGIGITAGENMQQPGQVSDSEWLWRAYGEAIQDVKKLQPDRPIRLIQRAHWASLKEIESYFKDLPCTLDYSYKYSQAHMYSAERPPFIELDGFLDEMPPERKTWLTVRNDDYYYFRWGDPSFARQYILNMPPSDRLVGFYMGADGYIWGKDYILRNEQKPRQLILRKMEYSLSIWGKLAYNPLLSDDHFRRLLAARFPEAPSVALYEAWASASRIFPLVTTFHWQGNVYDFQWYPEACFSLPRKAKGFHTVNHFIEDGPMPESGLMSIPEYCDRVLNRQPLNGITPYQVAADVEAYAEKTLSLLSDMPEPRDEELISILADLECMAWIGLYYAEKIRGAIELCFYRKTGEMKRRQQAIAHLKKAAEHWRTYADKTMSRYVPQLLNRQGYEPVDLKKLQDEVDRDIQRVDEVWD